MRTVMKHCASNVVHLLFKFIFRLTTHSCH